MVMEFSFASMLGDREGCVRGDLGEKLRVVAPGINDRALSAPKVIRVG